MEQITQNLTEILAAEPYKLVLSNGKGCEFQKIVIQLKDNFAQQGLKVESIEVNVQTQGFERSLDQQNQQNSQNEEKNKRSGRRIRLEGLGALEDISLEEMPEEDKVVADMMIRNGNSVDYTV